MAPIAVIGWGSLLWDLDDLAPRVEGDWARGAGPRLPFEFSRVSPKRLMSLVVIIDPRHGDLCPTHVIRSRASGIEEAVQHLAERERTGSDHIGACCLKTGARRSNIPGVADDVAAWCGRAGWAGAVWTDLPADFEAKTGIPWSVPAGVAYLRTLQGASLAEAKRYIDGAPKETDTPLRRALARDPWWARLAPAPGAA